MDAKIYSVVFGGEKCEWTFEVILQGGIEQSAQGAYGVACSCRVGGVRFDEDSRPVATEQIACENLGDIDHKLNVAALEHFVSFGFRLQLTHEIKIRAVLDRMQQSAALWAVVGQKHGGSQVLGVHIDGIAKEDNLKQRDTDHHAKSQPVPAHLDEFLDTTAQKRARENARAFFLGQNKVMAKVYPSIFS